MEINKAKKSKASYLLIQSKDVGTVFEIDGTGAVFWLRGKTLTQAKTDKQLGRALGKALETVVELSKAMTLK